jgi:hypothetical protein
MTRSLLITAASLAALIAPAQGLALGNNSISAVTVHSGSPRGANWRSADRHLGSLGCDSRRDRDRRDRDRRDGDRRGRHGSDCAAYLDAWSYYNPDFNRSWDSDSYNDWWHDRPDRAYPRWVQHNEGCDPDRMWWSGRGWHC